jgi:hypothetical protein
MPQGAQSFADVLYPLGLEADMDPTIVAAIIGAVGVVIATVIGYLAVRRNGRQESSSASGPVAPDTTRPRVVWPDPEDLHNDVSPDIRPTVMFSKAIDSESINPITFKLLDQATLQQVPPSVREGVVYDEDTRRATFTPAQPLENGESVEHSIGS